MKIPFDLWRLSPACLYRNFLRGKLLDTQEPQRRPFIAMSLAAPVIEARRTLKNSYNAPRLIAP
jgi:hypothetical protein